MATAVRRRDRARHPATACSSSCPAIIQSDYREQGRPDREPQRGPGRAGRHRRRRRRDQRRRRSRSRRRRPAASNQDLQRRAGRPPRRGEGPERRAAATSATRRRTSTRSSTTRACRTSRCRTTTTQLEKQASTARGATSRAPRWSTAGVTLVLALLYLVPMTAITGRTLGMRGRKIRVVRVDGSPVGWFGRVRPLLRPDDLRGVDARRSG